jgi:hypothetical protein
LSAVVTRRAGSALSAAGAVVALLCVGAVRPAAAQNGRPFVVYGLTSTPNAGDLAQIYRVDPVNRTSASVFNTGVSNVNGVAFDATSQRLFYRSGSDNDLGGGNGSFYAWNSLTNTQTTLARSGGVNLGTIGFTSAAFYGGYYWAIATNSNDLYRVSLTSTTYTAQLWTNSFDGTAGGNYIFGDIAINSSGHLYGWGSSGGGQTLQFFQGDLPSPTSANPPANNPSLTNFTSVAPSGVANNTNNLLQIALGGPNASGQQTLYGHNRNDGSWYTVNQTTGALTQIQGFTTPGFNDISDFQPVPAPSSVVSLGIGASVGLLRFGATRCRRRRAAATAASAAV